MTAALTYGGKVLARVKVPKALAKRVLSQIRIERALKEAEERLRRLK